MRLTRLKSASKICAAIAVIALLASSHAAYAANNISIPTDIAIQLTASGLTVTLAAGSNLVSFSAGSTTLNLNLDPTSYVTVKSTNLYTLTNSISLPTQCSGTSYSYVDFTTTTTQAVTLTPSATVACTSGGGRGGGGGGGGGSLVVLPTISSFSASPADILAGQSSALSWSVTNASRITITPAVGTGALNSLSGTATATPATTTIYTLTAFNAYSQSVSTTTTVTVLESNTAPQALPTTTPPSGLNLPTASTTPAYCLVNGTGTFYLILNGIRHGITDPGILYSYGYGFSSAISDTGAYQELLTGNLLPPNDGALAKTAADPTVYLIADSQRHGFTSAPVFLSLGFKFSSVLVVTAPDLSALPLGAVIPESGVKATSSGLERLQAVDLAEYVVDEVA
jgi:hypothetical protein